MCVWISVFRRRKQFENPIIGCRDIKQKPSLILFGTPCSGALPAPQPLPLPPLECSRLPLGCRIGSKAAKKPNGTVGGGRLSSPEKNFRKKDLEYFWF